jgi:hypothetical protein
MKHALFIVLLAIVVAAGAAFAAGSIVSSFQSPFHPTYVKGMDYYGGYIWHVSNGSSTIYRTNTTGTIVSSFTGPSATMGVHCTGSYLWTCSYSPRYVYYMTTAGSVISSFMGPNYGYGLTFDGTYLWFSSAVSGNYIYRMTTTGSVLNSFVGPGTFNGGLDYVNGYLWVADWPSSGAGIYRITTTGSVVESYVPVPSGSRTPGVTWDGTYVWYNDYSGTHYVYRMTAVQTTIVPTSIGKVKALFR